MRYFVGFLVTIGLLILLVIILAGGGGDPEVEKSKRPLVSYARTDAATIMTVDGPVNAAQVHEQIRITVTRDQVRYERLRGYDGAVQESKVYGNTENSYGAFLRSLALAGYTNGDDAQELRDERGYCPLGNRYIFELTEGGSDVQRYWTTSCNKTKSFLGDRNTIVELFRNQVPDYNQLERSISL